MSRKNKSSKAVATTAAPATTATTVAATPPVVVVAGQPNALLAQPLQAGKPYNVRPNTASDNAATWQLLQAALVANGGTLTRQALKSVAKQRNHVSFVGYAIRRGWLVPSTPAAAPQAPASA